MFAVVSIDTFYPLFQMTPRFLGAAKMRSFVPLFLVGILFPAIPAKQFTKCELSQLLKDIDGYGGIALPELPSRPRASLPWLGSTKIVGLELAVLGKKLFGFFMVIKSPDSSLRFGGRQSEQSESLGILFSAFSGVPG
ncbi:PREDICTED: alpha-lactalbumin isoform X3 [Rhinopithecus bieti]|uniref:alpha-lactalbumin isoform X3 n=1 Tax=Rhinopithecus bieti TaxID=61621 RepID=UPI00083C8731|nr:PREDICTED: alpha-lactalbumin isoform X3 [Rhinopithecus bieti]